MALNDLLFYLPIFDLWAADHGAEHLLHFLSVHSERWLDENLAAFAATARRLWDRGYSFDFVSDQLLEQAVEVAEQQFRSRGGLYKALVLAGCTLMPPATLRRIVRLVQAGATVVVVGELPNDVPGLGNLAERRQQLRAALSIIEPLSPAQAGIAARRLGAGRLLVGQDIEALLEMLGIQREPVVDTGVELIRRRDEHGYLYFLANLGQERLDQWVRLPIEAASVVIFDPLDQRRGIAQTRPADSGAIELYHQLEPGAAILLRTSFQSVAGAQWPYLAPAGETDLLEGTWRVEFIEGGPTLPGPATLEQLTSWTEWQGVSSELRAFAGTARYTTTFTKPGVDADAWTLDLGAVYHSARIMLNGRSIGTCYARPFQLVLPAAALESENVLEIEVTNLMANRLPSWTGTTRRGARSSLSISSTSSSTRLAGSRCRPACSVPCD